jgi:hypothetical protein
MVLMRKFTLSRVERLTQSPSWLAGEPQLRFGQSASLFMPSGRGPDLQPPTSDLQPPASDLQLRFSESAGLHRSPDTGPPACGGLALRHSPRFDFRSPSRARHQVGRAEGLATRHLSHLTPLELTLTRKRARNSFRIHSYKIIGLKLPWNHTVAKIPGVGRSALVANTRLKPHFSPRSSHQLQIVGLKLTSRATNAFKEYQGVTSGVEERQRIWQPAYCPDRLVGAPFLPALWATVGLLITRAALVV